VDIEEKLNKAIQDGISEGIKTQLTRSYKNPLDELIEQVLKAQESGLRSLCKEAIESCVANPEFRKRIITETQAVLAKTLVQRFGGEIEKQVNALKSDPTTRARITMAIEEIVATK
jgi:hypothetical protein